MIIIPTSYSAPKAFSIRNIPSVVVDPHNEVFPYWHALGKSQRALIHIDDHADMADGVAAWNHLKNNSSPPLTIGDYASKCLGIGSFISAAVHEEIISCVYFIRPRTQTIFAYSRMQGSTIANPLETRGDVRAIWDGPTLELLYFSLGPNVFRQDVLKSRIPLLLDIDLDAFHLYCNDQRIDDALERGYDDRLKWAFDLISGMNSPQVITIARSQTPKSYVHPSKVDEIQQKTLEMLAETFSNQTQQPL